MSADTVIAALWVLGFVVAMIASFLLGELQGIRKSSDVLNKMMEESLNELDKIRTKTK